MKPKLLIIEDDQSLRIQMKWALAQDYEVFLARDRPGGLEIVKEERLCVVILDLGLPPSPDGVEEGFLSLSEILSEDALTKIIVVTGHDEKKHALTAIGHGAYDFFCRPIQIDELKIVLGHAFYLSQLEREHRGLQQRLSYDSFEGMLGTSPRIQRVFAMIRKVATTDAPVLIVGENGTGKELVARAIHGQSNRKERSFVAINCGAIPETLLESELFGHEKGAFRGTPPKTKIRSPASPQRHSVPLKGTTGRGTSGS